MKKKKGIKEGSKIKFYTDEEADLVYNTIHNASKKKDAAKVLAAELRRLPGNVMAKYYAEW